MKSHYSFVLVTSVIFSFLMVPTFLIINAVQVKNLTIEEKREIYISQKNEMRNELIAEGGYACCLKNSCSSCIETTPWHGEGAECHCLADVVTGKYPCGECAGGILAGRGNKFLAPYFARAIAEGIGMENIDVLRNIISQKYNISIEDQL